MSELSFAQEGIIKKALLEIELLEINHIEKTTTLDFVPSTEYEEYIEKLLNKSDSEKKRRRLGLRRIIALAAAVAIIFAMAITAFAFRKQIADFIETQIKGGLKLEYNDGKYEKTTGYYKPTKIPSGFEITYYYESSTYIITEWSSSSDINDIMVLEQTVLSDGYQATIDTESEYYKKFRVENYTVHYNYKLGTHSAIWNNEQYAFVFNCTYDITLEEIKEMILTMEVLPLSEDGGVPEGN